MGGPATLTNTPKGEKQSERDMYTKTHQLTHSQGYLLQMAFEAMQLSPSLPPPTLSLSLLRLIMKNMTNGIAGLPAVEKRPSREHAGQWTSVGFSKARFNYRCTPHVDCYVLDRRVDKWRNLFIKS